SSDTSPNDFGTGSISIEGIGDARFQANNATVGGANPTPTNDHGEPDGTGGDWTYAGGIGTLTVSTGTASIAHTLTLQGRVTFASNGTETFQGGVSVFSGASLEIGGTAGAPADSLQIDQGGLLIGHGVIDSSVTGQIHVGKSATTPAYSLSIND